ncbi:hypothetical protein D9Q98_008159 [Chlorella vulgaris]|uniref:Ribosomal RNA small subunit methyltransferase G n=1 Tax=Chlorella vulgaris TaxID=3077 RepID=A0A9D4TG53_CHLVU|nr:hypothetical protein D9Q98_008159 [Chlorella vulgaris]
MSRRLLIRSLAQRAAAPATPCTEAAPKFVNLPAEQQQQIDAYLDILLEWNKKLNLISRAVTEKSEAYSRHVDDSLALLPAIDRCLAQQRQYLEQHPPRADAEQQQWQPRRNSRGSNSSSSDARPYKATATGGPRVVDVGSGAGLPGIILAIVRPEWEVTLLDSLQKRCKFTQAAVEAAGLTNVRVHCARAELAGRDPALRDQYDLAVARAVAELRVLAELCLPLVRTGGHWVAAKGAAPQDEVAGAKTAVIKVGGKLLGLEEVDSEGPEGPRTAVLVRKACPTPHQYPREPGVPGRKPLC